MHQTSTMSTTRSPEILTSTMSNATEFVNFDNLTEIVVAIDKTAEVWPTWINITVPLICIIIFMGTLVIIFLKPSKPGDEPLFFSLFGKTSKESKLSCGSEGQEIDMTEASWRPSDYVKTEYC